MLAGVSLVCFFIGPVPHEKMILAKFSNQLFWNKCYYVWEYRPQAIQNWYVGPDLSHTHSVGGLSLGDLWKAGKIDNSDTTFDVKVARRLDLARCSSIDLSRALSSSFHWTMTISIDSCWWKIFKASNICYGHYVMSVTKRDIFLYPRENLSPLNVIIMLLF